MKNAVIFGGAGFIGTFFARHLIEDQQVSHVYLYDHEPVSEKEFKYRKKIIESYPQITMIKGDVRETIDWVPSEPIDLRLTLPLSIESLAMEITSI